MDKKTQINQLLQQHQQVGKIDFVQLQNWINQYPFFQSLQCVYLKKLYLNNSFQYNTQLKKTAAITSSRAILFDYITSKTFLQQDIAEQIQNNQLNVEEEFELGMTSLEAKKIANPDLFVPKVKSGEPLHFSDNEKHSFNQWLQLTKVEPIQRSEKQLNSNHKRRIETEKDKSNLKMDKIDSFLKANPKIKPTKNYSPRKEIKLKTSPSSQLMTETLARVYEEQKAYEKAIQAYKILILNNPEKNSFFATQIERLEQLLENNI